MGEKIYCGSAKARQTQYGEELTVSVNVSKVLENLLEHGYVSKNQEKFITLKISQRKETGKYGETHTVIIDTWKPDSSRKQAQPEQNTPVNQERPQSPSVASQSAQATDKDLPFSDDIPF